MGTKIQQPNEFSLSQLWILGGSFGQDLNSIEAGWQETHIRRHVNRLRKHSSNDVRRLVKHLVRKWKDIVDELVKLNPPAGHEASALMELNKWIDERIANCESPNDYENGEVMSLLFSLLKIAYQYYGKLRSPFGTDPVLKESDCAESAVAKLFGSAKRNDFQMSYYGPQTYCLQNLPAEAQIQATTLEVQKLLVSGRKKEALECAREGQLWGPALVLASQLGDQLYGDTLKQMAIKQLVVGSPLRTLCLLIAGQPADVFSNDAAYSIIPASVNTFQQPVQSGANFMLDNWEENLAIITANRTKGDELVIVHLGDCLWKERGEVAAAHACYLVANSNFEPYSDNARLCHIGADHWKFPRTYASPQAIQVLTLPFCLMLILKWEPLNCSYEKKILLLPFFWKKRRIRMRIKKIRS
ncbi:hypothetical protein LWI29_008965 [Acer saccharum]|uniref:TFIIS N-terminal domain-containing protein n=1 Tax=Acer saccharum TaxID=4024 RepID=A0AA39S209_ACESA|nr:hypothetical protein LWI29_008965 [Acer saccharum]